MSHSNSRLYPSSATPFPPTPILSASTKLTSDPIILEEHILSSDLRNSFPGRQGECQWICVGRGLLLVLSKTRLCLVIAWNRPCWRETRGSFGRGRRACRRLGLGGSQRSREAWWFVGMRDVWWYRIGRAERHEAAESSEAFGKR